MSRVYHLTLTEDGDFSVRPGETVGDAVRRFAQGDF